MHVAYTIKINDKRYQDAESLEDAVICLLQFMDSKLSDNLFTYFEEDSRGVIHAHGAMLCTPEKDLKLLAHIFMKDRHKGCYLFLKEIVDLKGWEKYCKKNLWQDDLEGQSKLRLDLQGSSPGPDTFRSRNCESQRTVPDKTQGRLLCDSDGDSVESDIETMIDSD